MDYKFYDTSSLLLAAGELFKSDEKIVLSSITLSELEHIKTSNSKDIETKNAARYLTKQLDLNDNYELIIFKPYMLNPMTGFEVNNDLKILACAYDFYQTHQNLIFITNDLVLKNTAKLFFKTEQIQSVNEDNIDSYTGYLDVTLNEEAMVEFYSNLNANIFDLLENQYLIIREQSTSEIVDKFRWTADGYQPIKFREFNSQQFGRIKPLKGDIHQLLAMDCLSHNKITMLKGPAGSGKSWLSFGYLFSQLESGKIDKIIIFCNPVATYGSARLGFYPGTKDEKLLDSQIGNLLSSKLGSRYAVEDLLQREKLIMLPFSDIRGYDTTNMRAGVYIPEAQNLDTSLMKLALQRIGEDSICIIDGDCKAQVDDMNFSGINNGMKKCSKVFRGTDVYGEIELQTIHRSKIAQIAEKI